MQQIAKAQNASLVQYSIIYDDFTLQGKQEARQSELYIWVIEPDGTITFRKTDLKPLWQQQNISLADLVVQSRETMGARGRAEVVVSPDTRTAATTASPTDPQPETITPIID
ncbi:hypothetical protein [Leptothermofonsia sp. ETS-13]|uniref:hypothetical protein n=1 Tax=Leptothermofonsia sp. ETS-13 TaxID=3035696 RepID=UPI003BA2BD79